MPDTATAAVTAGSGDEELRSRSGFQRARAFRQNFLWTLAANLVYAGCQWAMLVVLAKFSTAAEVGAFAWALAVTAPVVLFSGLQLRSIQATDVRGAFTFREYVSLRLWTTGAALAVIAGLALWNADASTLGVTVAVVGLSKCFESLSDVLHGHLQAQEQMTVIAQSMMLKGLLSIALMSAATLMMGTAAAAAAGLCLASVVVLAGYDIPAVRARRRIEAPSPRDHAVLRARLWKLAVFALPLGIVQGLVSLNAGIPRYVLEHSAGLAELGIFSALASLIVAGQTVVSALGNVASPRLAQMHSAGDTRAFKKLVLQMVCAGLALGFAGCALAAAAGERIASVLFRPEYGAHSDVLVTIALGAAFAYAAWFLGFAMTAAQLLREQIPLLAAVSLISYASAAVLVPRAGALGAAMSFAAGMAAQAIGAAGVLLYARRVNAEEHGNGSR